MNDLKPSIFGEKDLSLMTVRTQYFLPGRDLGHNDATDGLIFLTALWRHQSPRQVDNLPIVINQEKPYSYDAPITQSVRRQQLTISEVP